ncbi:MAG: hypothetical protein EOO20_14390 [Chryseobacterium sp.]|nr:MAG: hypothetical protein EOO20_14390 [Chryseobacterium sp.]
MSIDFKTEKAEFEALKSRLLIQLDALLTGGVAEEKDLQDRLYKMIDYAIKRHDWYEDQKQKLLQIGLALLSVFAAFTAVVAKLSYDGSIEGLPFLLCLAFVGFGLGTGILMLYKYNRTISLDHPYRKVVDIRSWFFKYNFDGKLSHKISGEEVKARSEVKVIIDSFENFSDKWITFAKEKKRFLAEDIEQVFILQILQKYRSEQLKTMSKVLTYGVFISVLMLVFAFFAYVGTGRKKTEENSQRIKGVIDSTRKATLDSLNKTVYFKKSTRDTTYKSDKARPNGPKDTDVAGQEKKVIRHQLADSSKNNVNGKTQVGPLGNTLPKGN